MEPGRHELYRGREGSAHEGEDHVHRLLRGVVRDTSPVGPHIDDRAVAADARNAAQIIGPQGDG